MLFRMIAAPWTEMASDPRRKAFEGDYTFDQILGFNKQGYSCYFLPNHCSDYSKIPINPNTGKRRPHKGSDTDVFEYCFVDLDLKDYQSSNPDRAHNYATKEAFIEHVLAENIPPTTIVDSGNGVHVYWRVTEMDPQSFLRLNRRLCRKFSADPAVTTLNQLMRVPGTVNVKKLNEFKLCEVLVENPDVTYDAETMHKLLPPIRPEDEAYCERHYEQVYNLNLASLNVAESLPAKFIQFAAQQKEAHSLFYGSHKDRSAADYRLACMLHANGFTKDDALSVLFNTAKAIERTKLHRFNYSNNLVSKVWVEATQAEKPKPAGRMIRSVKEILADDDADDKSPRFPCHPMIDGTDYGFRLTHVLGLIGGSGNGKTTAALNLFAWFSEYNANKDYIHVYVTLEMPEREIAEIWATTSAALKKSRPEIDWDSVVHILGNYNADGTFRDLGLDEIQEYVIALEKDTGKKVGCTVVDHIGILKQEKKREDRDALSANCKRLKSFAIATNTFVVIQSQTSRAKNGGGDMELDMDAAFGTSSFENYCDWIMTTWQPLKRVLDRASHMTVLAYKFAKMRRKNVLKDNLKADCIYGMMFDPDTGLLRELTSDEHTAFEFWNKQATQIRNKDRKREPAPLKIIEWTPKKKDVDGKANSH